MTTQNSGQNIFFLSAVRTPFGTYGGSLRDVPVVDFTSHAAQAAIDAITDLVASKFNEEST